MVMMTIDEAIKRLTDNAEYERTHGNLQGCLDFRQLTEWLRELKAYKELNTYNRSSKCSKCKHEDSAYFCDDCIWNFVNKFEQKEEMNGISN